MHIQALLQKCQELSLVVIGDLMLDHWVWGSVSRISPEAPIPVVDVERYSYTPGGAANVVSNLLALGVKVRQLGVVGRDDAGRRLRALLRRSGAEVSGILSDDSRPTTLKTRIVAHSQQMVRADFESRAPLSPEQQRLLLQQLELALPHCQAVVFSDYDKGLFVPELAGAMGELCRAAGRPLLGGPKPSNVDRFLGCSLITLNAKEAAAATGLPTNNHEQVALAGAALRARLPGTHVLVTRGEQGMTLFDKDGAVHHQKARAKQVFDVSGAGDTVLASLSWSLAAGATPAQSIEIASHAAAVVVTKVGTATATPEEIRACFT
jgi:rfaE bifunctional protein kinase chain/domain